MKNIIKKPKVAAFDLLGTLFDAKNFWSEREAKEYALHLHDFYASGVWMPFNAPEWWESMPAFDDVSKGLRGLRYSQGVTVVTLSNAPFWLTVRMLLYSGLAVDGIVPLEAFETFKTAPEAYEALFKLFPVFEPSDFLMVTANREFGDLEAATELGMQAALIRHEEGYRDIFELAEAIAELQK